MMSLPFPQAGHSTASFDSCCFVSLLYQQMLGPNDPKIMIVGMFLKKKGKKCILIVENALSNMLNLLNSFCQAVKQRNTLL